MKTLTTLFTLLFINHLQATILHVGTGQPYTSLEQAANAADPGDTIRVHEGTYPGGLYIEELQGTENAWIVIEAAPGATVIYDGGNNAWQFTDGAYLEIRGFIFEHQAGNGLNFDDGGTYATPTHHLRFIECTFRDMNASGNNDLLKLSGLDHFEIRSCTFLNGAEGGSGIDMVGCHEGVIANNYFENLGSNCIQAKGGTSDIIIEANFFKDGGQRSLNLGGSTGLQFFRPIDAPYEAARLYVYSNTFIGSVAPVAFVGCVDSEVINNTFYLPEKWPMRILQETVDPTRFLPCGDNTYRNNIIYMDQRVTVDCNIGPDTDPGSFTFSNNLWYHADNTSWPGPVLPAPDPDHIVGQDPLFENAANEDFHLDPASPAIGQGFDVSDPSHDHDGLLFSAPRSIGAFEGNPVTNSKPVGDFNKRLFVFPNPANESISVNTENLAIPVEFEIYDLFGRKVMIGHFSQQDLPFEIDITVLVPGMYFINVQNSDFHATELIIKE